jgi:hypothetical protein
MDQTQTQEKGSEYEVAEGEEFDLYNEIERYLDDGGGCF